MARETKAQREAREEAERLAYETEMTATYPQRLMVMMERAAKSNYELDVREERFLLVDRDDRDVMFTLTLEYNRDNQETLHEMDWTLDYKEEREREYQRKEQVKRSALAKLSVEERELLGV